ncbi:t-SNARE coiled-coil homology domain-containing protein [Caenorhabditis elegans]|uniref:t-SNARE coiled-coil homology domain-containing protein n=1 Tax=Caenorhabditis elegans TaxID=6239 RepID=O18230_CAEEL|nr:t-SNARE coiled-coil homology domain-containing protein [Caenorhabditis elegans]CAB16506.2 t-SNARE coiled-coil homology domain-containing protein [Caenorhabditis elegans]|eukprot:NP_502781.1 VTI (Vesicle Transport through t-SNARE Interaction) homolog [Caenorhabditis elegans]
MSNQSATVEQLSGFEKQYSLQTAEITSKIGRVHTLPSSDRAGAVQEIRKSLEEVNDLLDQMELVVRELESNTTERTKYELRVRSYQSDKKQLDTELEKAIKRVREEADRDELLAFDDQLDEHRQEDQLIANTQRLERSTRKVQDAHRIAVETEQIGAEMLSNLASQRETIGRSRDRLRQSNADLGRANKTLSSMIRRAIQNRLLLLIVTFLLSFMFLYIVYKAI